MKIKIKSDTKFLFLIQKMPVFTFILLQINSVNNDASYLTLSELLLGRVSQLGLSQFSLIRMSFAAAGPSVTIVVSMRSTVRAYKY
jgi:hypothetical protein